MAVKPIPDGFHTVTPSLVVKNAARLIDFMKSAFGAEERFRMAAPNGQIMHAEVKIGDSIVMLNDAMQPPPATSSLFLYMNDVDTVYQQALKAGAESLMAPANMFWGDRIGSVKDAFGNSWMIATHVEDVAPGEMEKRAAAFMKQ